MTERMFRLMTFLYVTPPAEAETALHDLRDLCTLDKDVGALNPLITMTEIPGRLQIEFVFSAKNLEDAESIASRSIKDLIVNLESKNSRDSLMQGSNTLSFA